MSRDGRQYLRDFQIGPLTIASGLSREQISRQPNYIQDRMVFMMRKLERLESQVAQLTAENQRLREGT